MKYQNPDQIIEISQWHVADDFGKIFPYGSKEKTLLISPQTSTYPFIKNSHLYLFKKSKKIYPWEFWSEIIAYKIGHYMGVSVPPAFVAFNNQANECGALIEWFYRKSEDPLEDERFVHGGDYFKRIIPGYDHKGGFEHNFESIVVLIKWLKDYLDFEDSILWWAKTLTFDAIIGNSDRHHDNWGVIWKGVRTINPHLGQYLGQYDGNLSGRFCPAFDNGSSLIHEIWEDHLDIKFNELQQYEKYIKNGKHHLKYSRKDKKRNGHFELIVKLVNVFPFIGEEILSAIEFDKDEIKSSVLELVQFQGIYPLSEKRCDIILKLIELRRENLKQSLIG